MNFTAKIFVAGLVLVAGMAFAADATDPTVKARQDLMGANGAAAKALGGMAGGEVAFDAVAAEAAKAALVANSADIAASFKMQAEDPAAKAKAEIWTNWDDFAAKAKALNDAATALDASTIEGVQAGMGAIGGACKACHMAYKS